MPIIKDLSVAIVTHNRPYELEKCLQSICRQTYIPKTVLVVDNDPQKSARQIVSNFEKDLPVVWVHKKKVGIPYARNCALEKCRTKYLAFVDDDCVLNKNWVAVAHLSISTNSKIAFVVGKTSLLNNHNRVALAQFKSYQTWFKRHRLLDTKNVIFNLHKIKGFWFDTSFKVFEDVDFDRQLKSRDLTGTYNPEMKLSHPEVTSLLKALKKNYVRGQYKSRITSKWGKIDGFTPILPKYTNFVDFTLKIAFILGYTKKLPQLITVVNNQDQGANGERLKAFYRFLHLHHCNVETIDSELEFIKAISSKKYLLLYGIPLLRYKILKILHDRLKIDQTSRLFLQTLYLRSRIIHRLLNKKQTSLAIIQYPEDMMVVNSKKRKYLTLYDSATIYFHELKLSGRFTAKLIKSIKEIESDVYQHSDFVSFHWSTYFDIAKSYGMKVHSPTILNWGCKPYTKRFPPPTKRTKIVHLGKLNSYWVDPLLIQNISQVTDIDFYSYENPDPQLYKHLSNFKGYLPSHDLLRKYRFGLITISKDDLRSRGFSAKHLLYISYGLPVLCPEWRKDKLLEPATIYYNEENFSRQVKKYSRRSLWLKKHQAAIRIAKELNWDTTLLPLLKIVDSINK
ncbi:hypothetical protein DRO61_07355 [Candidatus Bathyarchaeota archaeon]|nr:MAG: hypothetical protein DRO61_07355 [Candidatus Bathyarchaeota archaeon]